MPGEELDVLRNRTFGGINKCRGLEAVAPEQIGEVPARTAVAVKAVDQHNHRSL